MLLRGPVALHDIDAIVREMKARKIKDVTSDPRHGIVWEQVWELVPGVFLQLLEDYRSRSLAMVIYSEDSDRVVKFSELVRQYVNPIDPEEILSDVAAASIDEDRAHAIVRAGFGSPFEFDERFFSVIRDAMTDKSPRVRAAGVWATTYSFWPQYREPLRRVAETESDPDLREEAAALADAPADQYGRPLNGES